MSYRRIEVFHAATNQWRGIISCHDVDLWTMQDIAAARHWLKQMPSVQLSGKPEFWFTESGYKFFQELVDLYVAKLPPSITDIRIRECENLSGAEVYRDDHQVAIEASK